MPSDGRGYPSRAVAAEKPRHKPCPNPGSDIGRLVPRECLDNLAGDPFAGRMRRDTDQHQISSAMTQNDQGVEHLECNRRNDHKIVRGDPVGVVDQKRPPALGRRASMPGHVLANRRLSDVDTEFEWFAVDPRSTP